MGRLGIVVDGMGPHERASRIYRELAAIRRTLGLVPRQFRGTGDERNRRRSVSVLGLAGAVLYQHRAGRDRALYPARHSRDADLRPARRREPPGAGADDRGVPPPAARDRPIRAGAYVRAGALLHLHRVYLLL